MSYTINLTNGKEIIANGLADGSVDTTATSLTLIGKSYAGYGEFLNENFVHLLENFASPNSGANPGPQNPLAGQLWWDTTNNILRVYSGTTWKISTGATSSPFNSPPGDLSALGGDLWFDSTNQQLKIYSGSTWITIGPVATPATGDTGAFPSVMTDTLGGAHIVTQIRIAGVPYIIFSKDTFTSVLAGFGLVKAGINFSTIAAPSLQISTQDTSATARTLVERDSSAGITAAAITGTILTATNYITAPTFIGSFSGNLAGNVTQATSVTATTVSASGITASGGYTGTLLTASQPNITGLGTIISGTWNGSIVRGTYGGTGVNNGTNTLTFTSNLTLNQSVASGASPTFTGTNFSGIPNSALSNSTITIGGTAVPLGGTYSAPLNVSSIAGTTNQVVASAATGAVTLSLPQSIATSSGVTFGSLNIGSATGATTGQIRASDNIVAYASSDVKFKENIRTIPNAVDTVVAIGGDLFDWTDEYCEAKGGVDGYFVQKEDFGVIAQKVKAAFPIATRTRTDGSLAVDYEKLSALAFAAIVELQAEIAELKKKLN